ncbi:MAG: hypothetical protein WDO68_06570 [Gammaproteobacteria bacterium]
MRLSRNKKVVPVWDRRDALRKGRAAAETIGAAFPDAESVSVQLEFLSNSAPAHVPQSFSLFPPAKAHFVFPCPYGDCDGVYDLQAVALDTLSRERRNTKGSLKCVGTRSHERLAGRLCGLEVNYSITAKNRSSR